MDYNPYQHIPKFLRRDFWLFALNLWLWTQIVFRFRKPRKRNFCLSNSVAKLSEPTVFFLLGRLFCNRSRKFELLKSYRLFGIISRKSKMRKTISFVVRNSQSLLLNLPQCWKLISSLGRNLENEQLHALLFTQRNLTLIYLYYRPQIKQIPNWLCDWV